MRSVDMSSNDNVISLAEARQRVELPSDVEPTTDTEGLPPPPAVDDYEARRQQLINYLSEFLALHSEGIDSFMFIASVQKPGEFVSSPVMISSPLSPEREAFFVSNLQAIHHQRLQNLWSD